MQFGALPEDEGEKLECLVGPVAGGRWLVGWLEFSLVKTYAAYDPQLP